MSNKDLNVAKPGEALPSLTCGPVTRWTLAAFMGGSGDLNPIHVDTDAARAAGLDDVIAHGMLSMAYLGRFLNTLVPQSDIASFRVRFTAPTPVGTHVRCEGVVKERQNGPDRDRIRLSLRTVLDDGTVTTRGEAVVEVEARSGTSA